MSPLSSLFTYTFLLLSLWAIKAQAQTQINHHIGFNLGRMPFEAFNQVIEHYNQTRPWLNDDLNTHRWMPGFSLGIHSKASKGFSLMLLEFNSRFRRSRVSGTSPSGQDFERQLHSRFVQLSVLGLAYNLSFGSAQKHRLGFSATLLDNGFYRLRSKTNDEKWERVNLQDDAIFVRGLALSNTFGLEYSYRRGPGQNAILVQLYYQPVWLGDFNFIELNQDLNPSTWELHYSRRLSGSPHNWGIKVLYCIPAPFYRK